MASWYELRAARREGSLAAQRFRRRMGLAAVRRVDVFDLVDSQGLWLMFQPLKELYGFYRRIGATAGIVVNAGHPLALQRYTAAHELGHYVLGHMGSLDEAAEIGGVEGVEHPESAVLAARSHSDFAGPAQEAAAQEFAASLLMPVQMVNRVLLDGGFDRDAPHLSPTDVYAMSLEFGTSYDAMLTQLAVLRKIGWGEARQMRLAPLKIKTVLNGGREPANSRADVWLVRDQDRGRTFPLRVEDEIVLRLSEIPSSGYAWELVPREWSALALVDQRLDAEVDPDVLGGAARRTTHLRATMPGKDTIVAHLTRPWEEQPAEQITFHIEVAGSPTGDMPHGLLEVQQLRRLALVA
jgi:predicted secreted protein